MIFWCFRPQPKQDLPVTDPIPISENGCFITQALEQRPVIFFIVHHTFCVHQHTEMHVKNMICQGDSSLSDTLPLEGARIW